MKPALTFLSLAIIGMLQPGPLHASLCLSEVMGKLQPDDVPLFVVARVWNVERENGPHFTGNPKKSAPPQKMVAVLQILRSSLPLPAGAQTDSRLTLTYIGRDGPDFSLCEEIVPNLEPGQTVLLPLQPSAKGHQEKLEFMTFQSFPLAMRVVDKMRLPPVATTGSRTFVIRELVNSLLSHDPLAMFDASMLISLYNDDKTVEPELTTQLTIAVGNDADGWAQILANMLLTYRSRPLTLLEIHNSVNQLHDLNFSLFPLARFALSKLHDLKTANAMVTKALVTDLPAFTDEPFHPLFEYDPAQPQVAAITYLARYKGIPALTNDVTDGLNKGLPGYCFLAYRLIQRGQTNIISVAVRSALSWVRSPARDGKDIEAAINLIVHYGTDEQRAELAAAANQLESVNPDYATFLRHRLSDRPS